MKRNRNYRLALAVLPWLAASCGGDEAIRVELPVVASGVFAPGSSDLGYQIEISRVRLALDSIEFNAAAGGSVRAETSLSSKIGGWFIGTAHAHPGHFEGGEIIGELAGSHLLDLSAGAAVPLGSGTFLASNYATMSFAFRHAGSADGLQQSDPLFGHTMHIELSASRGGQTYVGTITIDIEDGQTMVGAPFESEVSANETSEVLLEMLAIDPFENDTFVDGLDFAAISDAAGEFSIVPGSPEHNVVARALATHDHYFAELAEL